MDDTDKRQKILIAIVGLSPSVLTETVYSLCLSADPIIPDRVIVLTTSSGRDILIEKLFNRSESLNGVSAWQALRTHLKKNNVKIEGKLRFGKTGDDIRVLTSQNLGTGISEELGDIRTANDNQAAADFILEQVRPLTENPDTRIIASLAGGRKTMGALLYACMTLLGREDDLLTHILVNEPFDRLPDFFFPGQPGPFLKDFNGTPFNPKDAVLELAQTPFVALRNLFTKELGRLPGTFSNMVQHCQRSVQQRISEDIQLIIESSRPDIEVNGRRIKLSSREHLVMLFLAERAKSGSPAFTYYEASVEPFNEFVAQVISERDPNLREMCSAGSLNQPFDERDLRRLVSDLRRKFNLAGESATLLASCLPEKGRFSLATEPSLIEIRYT